MENNIGKIFKKLTTTSFQTVQSRRPRRARLKGAINEGAPIAPLLNCDHNGVARRLVEMRFIQPNTVF